MRRSVLLGFAISAGLSLTASLAGCGGSSVKSTNFPVPASLSISPSATQSLEVGAALSFSAAAHNSSGSVVIEPISFHSSNTAIVTVANNGLACAGTWDSLAAPVVCTPGPVGIAEITATAQGVSSPPATVYTHQHIDSVVISPVPTNPPNNNPCVSKDLTADYQASAFSRGADITSTVGQFTWSAVTPQVVFLDTTKTGLPLNQVEAKALTPGVTQISASASGTNSLPFEFIACPVQSISLVVTNTNSNSFVVTTGSSASIAPTVLDSLGNKIAGANLTYCSSQPGTAMVGSSNCSLSTAATVSAATTQPGAATIIASCTPPSCNIGFSPSLPIYPSNVVTGLVTRNSTGTAPTGTVYVSSTGCGTIQGCISTIVPVSFPANTVGGQIALPATPNSLVFAPNGGKAYLGTDFGQQGTHGLMVLNITGAAPVQQFPSVTGRVLAVSPNGNKVIVSDRNLAPNQVFVFDSTSNTSATFQITGATAADFSPDGLKAYILAGSKLYVYSTVDALQTIPLTAPATDVAFLADGSFGYMVGGDPAGVSFLATCEDPNNFTLGSVGASGVTALRTLADGRSLLALAPPNIETITATITGTPTPGVTIGCPAPLGFLTVTNAVSTPVNFGQGNFVPAQFIVSPDGSKAYVISSTLSSILVFDIAAQTSSAIQLAGDATPLSASLTPEGSLLYVGTRDGLVHVLDTVAGSDIQQITFPTNPSVQQGTFCDGVTFQTVATVKGASQSGSDTTYTYTLTSGSDLQVGTVVVITGMADAGNNGTFTVTAVGSGTFTVVNPSGVTASSQNGVGTVNLTCNPDLVAVRP
jgi:trimeric autotransporter adhesin